MADRRMFRAIVLGGASLVGAASAGVICDACSNGETAGPNCPAGIYFSSPCGVSQITTTCAGATTASCPSDGPNVGCAVGPIDADCTITVVLGDGTSHTFPVTVGQTPECGAAKVVTSSPPSFSSATCTAPQPDASADAEAADVVDAAEDADDAAVVDAEEDTD